MDWVSPLNTQSGEKDNLESETKRPNHCCSVFFFPRTLRRGMGENFPPAATEAWLSPRSRRRSLSPRALMAEILSGEADGRKGS